VNFLLFLFIITLKVGNTNYTIGPLTWMARSFWLM
jgi:hypothetical protein